VAAPQTPAGQPPKFVPTLTEVVQVDDIANEVLPAAVFASPPPTVATPSVSVGPLAPGEGAKPPAHSALPLAPTPQPPLSALPEGIEEYIVHRVMQRVDVVLDQRLREAIATVVQEQTRSLVPRLREEVESVVRHAVYEAVADELAPGRATPL
jgi:hypothetical protein